MTTIDTPRTAPTWRIGDKVCVVNDVLEAG